MQIDLHDIERAEVGMHAPEERRHASTLALFTILVCAYILYRLSMLALNRGPSWLGGGVP